MARVLVMTAFSRTPIGMKVPRFAIGKHIEVSVRATFTPIGPSERLSVLKVAAMPAVIGIARSRSRAAPWTTISTASRVGWESKLRTHSGIGSSRLSGGLRAAGGDSLVIKELMGPQSLATTAIYIDGR